MSRYPWKDLLTQWSEEIIESGEFEDELTPEVATSGWLGYPAATEEEIAAAEARLGTAFPPSYREFLQITNGWRMTTGFIERLRPAAEVQWFSSEDRATIDAWMSAGGSDAVPDEDYLVYGDEAIQPLRAEYLQTALAVSEYGDGIYLLNPQIVTPEAEWEAWFFAHWVPGADRYRSFWDLMAAEHDHFLYALKSSRGKPTPRADPSLGVDAEDLDGLLAALQTPEHRMNALQALGNLRDRRAFEPVLAIFQDSRVDLFTRECAARTLGELHDPRAVQPLIDTFRQTPAEMSDLQFASLLGSAAGRADSALDDLLGSITIQDMIAALEPMLGAGMAQHLQQTLTPEAVSRGMSEQLSYAARQGLLTLGDAALPALFDALQDPDPNVRREIASLLCHVRGQPGVFEQLVVTFDDPDPAVRSAVAANIEQLFDNRAVDPLLQALGDPDSTVRTRAARSLGIIAARSDTDRIVEALGVASVRDADTEVRRVASQELDRLRGRKSES
jgi:HEAT repeat protein